jgi:hypothetical protein
MAAAVPALYSHLFGDVSKWENFAPSYGVLADHFASGAAATAAPQCRDGLVQLATRTPVVLAFVTDAECGTIYITHSLSLFAADVSSPTSMDGLVVGLIGDSPASSVPVLFPQAFFTLCNNTLALDVASIQGPAGHGAAPPVFRQGPHAAGTANAVGTRARRAMVLPPASAARALASASVDGSFTLLGFFNAFLQGPLSSADPLEVAAIEPLVQWWRLASTNVAAGTSAISSALHQPTSTSPRELGRLTAFANRTKDLQLSRLGIGGPGLSNAAFAHGVTELKTTLEATHQATLEFERARREKSFADIHGEALAQQVYRLCNVTRDADLPEVHTLLLKTPRGRAYGVLSALFMQRTQAAGVGLSAATAPVATTKLVDEVFRNYMPGNDGLAFGKGLTPFAIVCNGHDGISEILRQVQQAQLVESGASLSLADAAALTSDDVRFPTRPFIAVEKLAGWSVVVDVFHGVDHPVSISIRAAVIAMGSLLQRLDSELADTPGAGMELICRVMFEMQQDYFSYIAKVANGAPATVPTFTDLIEAVTTHRALGLSPLPGHWRSLLLGTPPSGRGSAAQRSPPATPATAAAGLRGVAGGSVAAVNPHADQRLMTRFKDSGHPTITAMVGNLQLEYPKQGGKPVCMAWALKGSCSSNCKRATQHVRYSLETVKALHKFLDDCGVANSQQ